MSASFTNRQVLRIATVAAMVLAAAACSDQQITGIKAPPVPVTANPSTVGMLRGTVREDGTVLLESLDPSIQVGDGASGAIYGNQNVTAKVVTTGLTTVTNGGTKTWTFKLIVHNLLNFPIGSIDGAAQPFDTVGMYIFFPTPPTVVSPANCGCSVTMQNAQGTANFTAPNQPYYWYHDRLAAKGQPGDSTTHNPTWKFSAPAAVTSFRFVIVLSSPWPRGVANGDTSWSVFYNPQVDSIPDVNGKPPWRTVGVSNTGSYTLSQGALKMVVDHTNGNSFFCFFLGTCYDDRNYYRSDNLARSENAFLESTLTLNNGGGSNPIVLLALADSVKFVGMGIGNGKVGFVTFNTSSLQWEWLGGPVLSVTTDHVHTYRIGKFGATSATIYVDGVQRLTAINSVLPNNFMPSFSGTVGPQAAALSTLFGITAQNTDATATVNYVTYAFHATPAP